MLGEGEIKTVLKESNILHQEVSNNTLWSPQIPIEIQVYRSDKLPSITYNNTVNIQHICRRHRITGDICANPMGPTNSTYMLLLYIGA